MMRLAHLTPASPTEIAKTPVVRIVEGFRTVDGDDVGAIVRFGANVVMFTSHTHWGLQCDDWAAVDHGLLPPDHPRAREVNARGVPMFNTGAHCNEDVGNGNINGDVESDSVDNIPSGLRVYVYAGRVRVEAWNFGTQTMYHAVEAPVTARGAATTEATTEAPRGVLGRDLPRSGAVSTTAPDIHGVVQPSYVQAGPPTGVIHV